MEMSRCLSEMGTENPDFSDEYQMDNLADPLAKNYPKSPSATPVCLESPTKQATNTDAWNACTTEQITFLGSSSPIMLCFGKSNSPNSHRQYYGTSDPEDVRFEVEAANENFVPGSRISHGTYINQISSLNAGQWNKRSAAQSSRRLSYSNSQGHVIAERNRREKLTQKFIELSAVVPSLKKLGKASILESSIRYMKELQGRVKTLEDQAAIESVVPVNKFQIPSEDDSSSNETSTNSLNELPEINARVTDKTVLIRIHCEKRERVLANALAEVEKLNLSVVSSSTIPFGTSTLAISIIAQIDEDFDMVVKDSVKSLRSSFC